MNISGGISEITFSSQAGSASRPGKIYLWPNYNAGRVNQIRGVVNKTESNIIYSKPLGEDIVKVIRDHAESPRHYTSAGSIQKGSTGTYPGMLFDAIA